MYIRWQSRKRQVYETRWTRNRDDRYSDVHWNAALIESVRVKGKPTQKHIANLCGFTEYQIRQPAQQIYIWERAIKNLDRVGGRLSTEDRRRIEAALAERLGRKKPTKREIAAQRRTADKVLRDLGK